jgi:DnaJ-class molecular chaperone
MMCYRCNGKGWTRQLTGVSEDDTTMDVCPECDGKGKVESEEGDKE